MIPEQFIDRLSHKSPCLHHGHGGELDDEVLDDADFDLDDGQYMATEDDEALDADHVEQENDDFMKDPSYLMFMARLDQIKHLRHHRLHPVSRYDDENDCKDCLNAEFPEGTVMPRLHSVESSDLASFGTRFIEALNDLAVNDFYNQRDCPICGQFHGVGRDNAGHWAFHRYNFLKQVHDKKSHLEVNDPGVESMSDKLERWKSGNNMPQLMHYLEAMCHMVENEVLEREEFCRICYESFDYGEGSLMKHYRVHHDEEKKQRDIADRFSELDDAFREGTGSQLSTPTSPATPPTVKASLAALWREAQWHEKQSIQWSPKNQPFVAFDVPLGIINAAVGGSASFGKSAASTTAHDGSPVSKSGGRDFAFKRSPRAAIFAKQQQKKKKGKAPISPSTSTSSGRPTSSGSGSGKRKAAKRVDSVMGSKPSSPKSNTSKSSKVQKRRKSA